MEILRAMPIYHKKGDLSTAYNIEGGIGKVLPFPTNGAKMFLFRALR